MNNNNFINSIYTHSLAFVTQKYHKPGTSLYILLAYDNLKYLTYISLQTTNTFFQKSPLPFFFF